ncbi:MAG: acyl-CoA/acyl-ACP dehydrogenase, partial [Robiginitomaculum sp.]|nr:acyl-CoA/acyl-ACP dehydrogenase [Robiginitomaculum sp.]
MDIEFSEDQRLIQNTARNFFSDKFTAQFIRDLRTITKDDMQDSWQAMADLGFMGIGVPQNYGGFSGSFVDVLVLMEELGRVTMPLPFCSTAVYATEILKALNNKKANEEILPLITSGAVKLAVILGGDNSELDVSSICLTANDIDTGFNINGTIDLVSDGYFADYFLCAARMGKFERPVDDIGLFYVSANARGVKRTNLQTINGNGAVAVSFDNVDVSERYLISQGASVWPFLERAMFRSAVAKTAEMVGSCSRIIEIVVEYAKERRQFGKAIGSFQAIQHHCADMMTDLDSARWMMYKTGSMIDDRIATRCDMAMNKAWCNQASRRILRLGHQVMGGIGYCEEHDMPLFFRYVRMAEAALGTNDDHLTIVANDLLSDFNIEKDQNVSLRS